MRNEEIKKKLIVGIDSLLDFIYRNPKAPIRILCSDAQTGSDLVEVIPIPCTEFGTGSIIEVDPDGDPHI